MKTSGKPWNYKTKKVIKIPLLNLCWYKHYYSVLHELGSKMNKFHNLPRSEPKNLLPYEGMPAQEYADYFLKNPAELH